ncbi:MAG: hypothetical protein O7B99_02620 [Planctomycetota bacterium]|nr:hypothetical protein [Planctomycetota bacterium]
MPMKRRILRFLLIVLAVLLFAGYFGFTTLFFDPLEGDFEADVSTLIPRNVDFYFAKAGLGDDIDSSFRPRFLEDLEESESGQALMELPWYRDVIATIPHEAIVAEVEKTLEQLPFQVDPLEFFGGRDVALAGYFRGNELADADWAVYGRVNWMGKLAVALLSYPDLIDLESQGLTVEEITGPAGDKIGDRLSGGRLARPLHVMRVRDVVAISTSEAMLAAIPAFVDRTGQDSFGQSAKYEDHIQLDDRNGDELKLYVDYRALSEARKYSGRWPDPTSEFFTLAFLGKLFQIGSIRELIGTLSFDTVVTVRMHAMLTSEVMTSVQKRLYGKRGFDPRALVDHAAARLTPRDAGLFVYGQGDFGDLLREALGSAEEALVMNLEDRVRSVWGYADCHPLIDQCEAIFHNRFAFVVRANDYPDNSDKDENDDGIPDDPPHDGTVVPAWALILWVRDAEKLEEHRMRIVNRQSDFGIQGAKPGTRGVFENYVLGGVKVYEYWNPLIPGTGHLASVTDQIGVSGGEKVQVFIISNNHKMLGHMRACYYRGIEQGFPSLADDPSFQTQVRAGLASADLILWMRPSHLTETWRGMAKRWASDKVVIDWSIERPRIDKRVLKRDFSDWDYDRLTPQQEQELDMLAQPERDAFELEFRGQHSAKFYAEYMERLKAIELAEAVLLEISLDQKKVDFVARVKAPLN